MDIYEDMKLNYFDNTAKYFSEKYGRTLAGIYTLASKLKLTKGPRRTKELSERVLKEYYENKLTIIEIHKLLRIGESTIGKILEKYGTGGRSLDECVYKRYECNDDYFEEIDTPEKAYWFGFILADGNLYNNKLQIALKESDKGHLEQLAERVGYNGKMFYEKNKGSWKLIIPRKKISNDLKKHGVTERKTLTIDETVFDKIPSKFLLTAIHGYFDGDGCFHLDRGNLMLSLVGNRGLMDKILQIFKDHGVDYEGSIYKDKRTKQTYCFLFRVNKKRAEIVKKMFYENEFSSKDFLQRKKDKLYSI